MDKETNTRRLHQSTPFRCTHSVPSYLQYTGMPLLCLPHIAWHSFIGGDNTNPTRPAPPPPAMASSELVKEMEDVLRAWGTGLDVWHTNSDGTLARGHGAASSATIFRVTYPPLGAGAGAGAVGVAPSARPAASRPSTIYPTDSDDWHFERHLERYPSQTRAPDPPSLSASAGPVPSSARPQSSGSKKYADPTPPFARYERTHASLARFGAPSYEGPIPKPTSKRGRPRTVQEFSWSRRK
jgi:hypothetical protein